MEFIRNFCGTMAIFWSLTLFFMTLSYIKDYHYNKIKVNIKKRLKK